MPRLTPATFCENHMQSGHGFWVVMNMKLEPAILAYKPESEYILSAVGLIKEQNPGDQYMG